MGCLKLHILDEQYKRTELKVCFFNKELTQNFCVENLHKVRVYAYCLNNPVRFIDPDGRDVWIYYEDEEGKRQQMLYTANMKYKGKNEFVSASVNTLNSVYNNGGKEVMDVLIGSSNSFNMKNEMPTDKNGNTMDALQFKEAVGGGGDILAGMLTLPNSSFGDYSKVEGTSHELFHGLQHEMKQGGASINNEVEANVYSHIVAQNWWASTGYMEGYASNNGYGNNTFWGTTYQKSFNSLSQSYSPWSFTEAAINFRQGSLTNSSGLYNKYPQRLPNQKVSLLNRYYPKVK